MNHPPPPRPSDLAFERQMARDPNCRAFTVRCGVCGKAKSQKRRWWHGANRPVRLLRREFNFCDSCERWVCGDCFLVHDGAGAIGVCAECAGQKGLKGYTNAQFQELLANVRGGAAK